MNIEVQALAIGSVIVRRSNHSLFTHFGIHRIGSTNLRNHIFVRLTTARLRDTTALNSIASHQFVDVDHLRTVMSSKLGL